jgi:hypothetical protein
MGRFSTLLIVRAAKAKVVSIKYLLHRLADRRLFLVPAAPRRCNAGLARSNPSTVPRNYEQPYTRPSNAPAYLT